MCQRTGCAVSEFSPPIPVPKRTTEQAKELVFMVQLCIVLKLSGLVLDCVFLLEVIILRLSQTPLVMYPVVGLRFGVCPGLSPEALLRVSN